MKIIFKLSLCVFIWFFAYPLYGFEVSKSNIQPTLSKNGLHNISLFNKVYGYARHFSPSLAIDTFYGWEDLLLKYLPRIESAPSDAELCDLIHECFYSLDPNILVKPYEKMDQSEKTNTENCTGFYVNRKNLGWGNRGENATSMEFLFNSSIQKTQDYREFKAVYQNISISMPLVACINDSLFNRYNLKRSFNPISRRGKYNVSDKYVRMGIIMEVWNVNEYFYPYMHVMDINNEDIFEKYIKSVYLELTEPAFFEILEKFGAEYKDGHAGFMPFIPMIDWPDYVPPLKLQMIENKGIVTYVADSFKHLIKVGDQVLKIDNISAEGYFKSKQLRVSSATKTWNKYNSEKELLCGLKNTIIKLELLKSKKRETIYLRRSIKVNENERNANNRPNYYEIKKGYFYVNLFNLNDSILDFVINNYLLGAQGIVFDVRGYPRSSKVKVLLGHLTNDTMYSSNWSIPMIINPSEKNAVYYKDSTLRWVLPPVLPRYTDNIVFITDGRIISSGESVMSIVEHYKLGKIVGEQTAGTNGNMNSFQVFGLYQFWHTQMYIPRYDGSSFQGVGIIPDVKVKAKSIDDVINGNDVFITTAIKFLR